MRRGEKPAEETIERAREMRAEGRSYGSIARELGISKATIIGYCRDVPVEEAPPGGLEPLPKVGLPRPSGARMSEQAKHAESKAQELMAEEQVAELEQRRKNRDRESAIELSEREAEAARVKAEAAHEELDVLVAKAKLAGPDDEIKNKIAELESRASAAEQRARDTQDRAREERHKFEMEGLRGELEGIRALVGNPRGASEYDVLLAGMNHLAKELAESRRDFVAFLQSPQTLIKFDPSRTSPGDRQAQGEELAQKVEAVAAKPACFVQGQELYCESVDAGQVPKCQTCTYQPPRSTMTPRS